MKQLLTTRLLANLIGSHTVKDFFHTTEMDCSMHYAFARSVPSFVIKGTSSWFAWVGVRPVAFLLPCLELPPFHLLSSTLSAVDNRLDHQRFACALQILGQSGAVVPFESKPCRWHSYKRKKRIEICELEITSSESEFSANAGSSKN
jgi:hypothetical protein